MQTPAIQRSPDATLPTPLFGRATTRATPGKMRLRAVREGGKVADFTWEFACGAAAHLLHCDPQALLGKRLRSMVAGPFGHPALIERYRRVLEHGNTQSFEQVHIVDGRQDLVVHRVARVGDGVEVTLTNLSACRRARHARLDPPLRRSGSSDQFA